MGTLSLQSHFAVAKTAEMSKRNERDEFEDEIAQEKAELLFSQVCCEQCQAFYLQVSQLINNQCSGVFKKATIFLMMMMLSCHAFLSAL